MSVNFYLCLLSFSLPSERMVIHASGVNGHGIDQVLTIWDHLLQITVWLLGLVAAGCGQSSAVTYGLAVVPSYSLPTGNMTF